MQSTPPGLVLKIAKRTASAVTINPATVGSAIVRILFFSAGCVSTDRRIKLIRQVTMGLSVEGEGNRKLYDA